MKNIRNAFMNAAGIAVALLMLPLQSMAQNQVSVGTAVSRAQTFAGGSAVTRQPVATFRDSDGNAAVYVFDNSDGGVIIVSADERTGMKILGRTERGDWKNVSRNEAFMDVIRSYADGIDRMRHAPAVEQKTMALPASAAKVPTGAGTQYPASVEPLLGDIEWGQGWPYNLMVPVAPDGSHYPTGCVATATAQVMYYHRWPERGQGSNSYYWNGEDLLEADFSQSAYRWDLMYPSYSGNESLESCNAVALLLRDIGIAFRMNYDMSGSGSNFGYKAMYENFDYDAGMQLLERQYCSTSQWEDVLRSELAAGRPVIVDGGSQGGAHEFVCDGYDADGYFHYNFGWNGMSNGWLASSATGFDSYPTLSYGIQPDKGGRPQLSLSSRNDFKWESGDSFSCELDFRFAYKAADFEFGMALRNISTGAVSVYTITGFSGAGNDGRSWTLDRFDFRQSVPDGSYKVYPVARVIGDADWRTFPSSELKQSEVDLTVVNGVKTYGNNGLVDPIDPGKVQIDGIYYRLDDDGSAAVTFKNKNYNSYSGKVTIPDQVTWNDVTYSVDSIAESAFSDCIGLIEVSVGKNVKIIDFGAFSGSSLSSIKFAEGSKLKMVGGWAFNGCSSLTDIAFPEGFMYIGMCAFQSCLNLKNVDIPASTYYIIDNAFNVCKRLSSVHVHWADPSDCYVSDKAFEGCNTASITLTVPAGKAGIYKSADVWKDFIIEEDDAPTDPVDPADDQYKADDPVQLYILGNDGNWDPSAASCVLSRTGSNRSYSGLVTVADAGAGLGYFCIGTRLGEDSGDWMTFNAYRLGAEQSDLQVYVGNSYNLYSGMDASFSAAAGTYAVTVCLTNMTMTVSDASGIRGIGPDSGNDRDVIYDLSGRRAGDNHNGIIILDGRKIITF